MLGSGWATLNPGRAKLSPRAALEGVWRANPARAVKLCKLEPQEEKAGALGALAGPLKKG